jgi:hypothetical protein
MGEESDMPSKRRASPRAHAARGQGSRPDEKITVENVNVPGYTTRLDAVMYGAMRRAILKVLPAKAPGLTQTQLRSAVLPHLPKDLFPGGAKAAWWAKAVQLDLEAKKLLTREPSKPLRWHRPGR